MRKVVILQARLSSSRFPRKVMADINGKPVIAHIIERLASAQQPDEICVAIPSDPHEDDLAKMLESMPVTLVRGSQHDVLGRFIQAAYQTRADIIVRATADNPLVQAQEVDRQIAEIEQDTSLDYVITEGYPIGVTIETFRLKTLEKLDYLARHAHMREHVTLYLRENPGPFGLRTLEAPKELTAPEQSLTLDTRQDYAFLTAIYERLAKPGKLIELDDVLALLKAEPEFEATYKPQVSMPASA